MTKTTKFQFNFLVRDSIPTIINSKNNGVKEVSCEYLHDDEEYIQALKDKLVEESSEVLKSKNKKELIEEIADVYEVLENLTEANKIDLKKIKQFQQSKNKTNGSFKDRNFMKYVEVEKGSEAEKYYLSRPEKFKKIK